MNKRNDIMIHGSMRDVTDDIWRGNIKMCNIQNDKMIAICKEISIKNEKTICYKVEDELKELFVSGNYLCRKRYDGKNMSISAIFVEEVIDFVDELTDVVEIGEDVSFLKTRDDLQFMISDEFMRIFQY